MTSRTFGWTGEQAPVIGQGTWMARGSSAVDALHAGLDLGMTHVDTAEMYGNEDMVGEAIAGRRDEVFLVTKVLPSNASYEGTLRACVQSLARLAVDRVDLYLLHWPGSHPIRETMRAMEKLVADGLTRYIGVSNFDLAELREAEAALRNERIACNQILYHLGDRGIERKLLPYCRERQIAVVGYSPFGHSGFRGGKVLDEIARRHGRTARQVALNFLTRDGVFTIPKASKVEHVRENAGGGGWQLSPEDIAAIDRAFPAPARDVPLGMI